MTEIQLIVYLNIIQIIFLWLYLRDIDRTLEKILQKLEAED